MSQTTMYRVLAAITLFFGTVIPLAAQRSVPPAAPDSGLFTNYSLYSYGGQTTVDWVVCGSTQNSDGCYSSGQLGPFTAVGAMLEGDPFVKGNVVTRAIYVVDSGRANDVKLYVYNKVDTVTADYDTATVTLRRKVTLPLTGGSDVSCSMAANKNFLFIGTDQTELAAMVQKSNLDVTSVGGVPGNVVAITSDQYGYVTITNAGSGFTDFTVLNPNGQLEEDGGGSDFVVGTTQAVPLATLAANNVRPASRIGYRAKVSAPAGIK
jgi:hypothetical protein